MKLFKIFKKKWYNFPDKLPEKGKDLVCLTSYNETRYLYRCACANENCKEFRCSLTGYHVDSPIIKWKYLK